MSIWPSRNVVSRCPEQRQNGGNHDGCACRPSDLTRSTTNCGWAPRVVTTCGNRRTDVRILRFTNGTLCLPERGYDVLCKVAIHRLLAIRRGQQVEPLESDALHRA